MSSRTAGTLARLEDAATRAEERRQIVRDCRDCCDDHDDGDYYFTTATTTTTANTNANTNTNTNTGAVTNGWSRIIGSSKGSC